MILNPFVSFSDLVFLVQAAQAVSARRVRASLAWKNWITSVLLAFHSHHSHSHSHPLVFTHTHSYSLAPTRTRSHPLAPTRVSRTITRTLGSKFLLWCRLVASSQPSICKPNTVKASAHRHSSPWCLHRKHFSRWRLIKSKTFLSSRNCLSMATRPSLLPVCRSIRANPSQKKIGNTAKPRNCWRQSSLIPTLTFTLCQSKRFGFQKPNTINKHITHNVPPSRSLRLLNCEA